LEIAQNLNKATNAGRDANITGNLKDQTIGRALVLVVLICGADTSAGLGQSWSKETFLDLAHEGTSLYPRLLQIYSSAVIYLLPRWFGSNEEVADYAAKSADQLKRDEGDILYARLAIPIWTYSYDINSFRRSDFFGHESGVAWNSSAIAIRIPHS
jgi:hypothetical protein